MLFLAETDDKKYKQFMTQMSKVEKVRHISDLVTFDGQIELTQAQVKEIQAVLAPKVQEAAITTEKSTMFLYDNIKRLGLDMLAISKTAENIQDVFQTLYKTSYMCADENTQDIDSTRYFYKSSSEAFSQFSGHMQSVSKYLLLDTSKFFEYTALEGERIG
jgi:hypothetical protein